MGLVAIAPVAVLLDLVREIAQGGVIAEFLPSGRCRLRGCTHYRGAEYQKPNDLARDRNAGLEFGEWNVPNKGLLPPRLLSILGRSDVLAVQITSANVRSILRKYHTPQDEHEGRDDGARERGRGLAR